MKKVILSLTVISAVLLGCNKETLTTTEESPVESTQKSNVVNPYEYIGEQHNLALAHIMSLNSTDYDDAVDYLSQSLNEPKSRFADWSTIQPGINASIADGYGEFHSFTSNPDIGGYIGNLETILLNSTTSNIESNISQLVSTILNSSSGLNPKNEASLLSTVALAKHSFIFWSGTQGGSGISNFWKDAAGFLWGFNLEWDNSLGLDGTADKLGDSLLSGLGGAVIASGS